MFGIFDIRQQRFAANNFFPRQIIIIQKFNKMQKRLECVIKMKSCLFRLIRSIRTKLKRMISVRSRICLYSENFPFAGKLLKYFSSCIFAKKKNWLSSILIFRGNLLSASLYPRPGSFGFCEMVTHSKTLNQSNICRGFPRLSCYSPKCVQLFIFSKNK